MLAHSQPSSILKTSTQLDQLGFIAQSGSDGGAHRPMADGPSRIGGLFVWLVGVWLWEGEGGAQGAIPTN